MIEQAREDWMSKYEHLSEAERQAIKMPLPLIRLRVSYTRHELGNLVRFGQEFVDKIANPRDVLQFSKKKVMPKRGKGECIGVQRLCLF